MFDIKWIRDNPEAFDAGREEARARAGWRPQLIALDEARRKVVTRLQEAQARRNAASKEIGKAKAAKDEAKAQALMAEVAALKDVLAKGEEEQREADKALHDALSVIPNLPRRRRAGRARTRRTTRRSAASASRRSSPGPTSPSSTSRSARRWA